MIGYTLKEMKSLGISQHAMCIPEDPVRQEECLREIFEGKRDRFELDSQIIKRGGGKFWGHVVISVVRDDRGAPQYFVHMLENIDDRKRAEAELAKKAEELERLNQELSRTDHYKDEFLSVISHELRTPLNAVTGFGSLLADGAAGPLNEQQSDFARKILLGAESMLVLVDDLLDFAGMQAGKFGVSPAETDYPSHVEETVASFMPTAGEKGIRIESSVEVPMPVWLDHRRIQQVIANLLTNAIKFTQEGGQVRLRAFVEKNQLITEVSDNGIGISPEGLPKLFVPFKQLDMGLTRRARGVGLGLSISKAIIEAHRGSIEAKSELGKGSTFTFRIPLA
jgi:PAS domain S-box-containing protein